MRSQISAQAHFEYRGSNFHWRRRLPQRVLKPCAPPRKTHILSDAKAFSQTLTFLSVIAFAAATGKTIGAAPDIPSETVKRALQFHHRVQQKLAKPKAFGCPAAKLTQGAQAFIH